MTTTHAPPMSMLPFLSASLPLFSPLPLWHQWQRVSTYLCLKSLITAHWYLLPLSICTILGLVSMPGVTIFSPLSSFSSLMNSRCVKVFERPYTWLAIWQPSSLLWSTSPICNYSVFLIHTCFLASVLWAFVPSSVLAFLDELYENLLMGCFCVLQQSWALCLLSPKKYTVILGDRMG